jgi:uncharacterized protein YprB with RNaseH-like and TPR domain
MDDALRARLEALNRAPLPNVASIAQRVSDAVKAATAGQVGRPPVQRAAQEPTDYLAADTFSIGGLVRRGKVVETPSGPHLSICMEIEKLWYEGRKLIAARQEYLQSQRIAAGHGAERRTVTGTEFAAFVAALPDRALALDLETCGLAGSALFLVGLLRQMEGVPTIQLLLARNYAEEAAVLDSLWRIAAEHDVLLTFNGKSFDWPMVIERSVRHRLQIVAKGDRWIHIDILHHARRRWRKQLPNCRLLTLERHVCRRTRAADIPGHAIPGVYAHYVRTGFERDMDTVLYHNALDLVTLFDLAHRLAA